MLAAAVSGGASLSNDSVVGCAAGHKPYCASNPRIVPYALSVAQLDAELVVRGSGWGELAPRLAPGHPSPPVRVVILGGSMTCAGDVRKADSWPSVLADHFRSAYGNRIVVVDRCSAATGLTWAVHFVSTLVEPRDDVVLVDYVQNDGRPTLNDVADNGRGVDLRTRVALEALLLALGRLVRASPPIVFFYCTFPPPKFFARYTRWGHHEWRNFWARGMDTAPVRRYLEVLHGHATNYEAVARHYGVTMAALQQALWSNTNDTARALKYWISDLREHDWNHHPGRDAHRLVADSVFHLWQRLSRGGDAPRPAFDGTVKPLASPAVLDSWSVCEHVTLSLSAEVECSSGNGTTRGWPCYRDKPQKPFGWIYDPARNEPRLAARRLAVKHRPATRKPPARRPTHPKLQPAAEALLTIEFIIPCSRSRVIGIEYLKSYSGMGAVEVAVETHHGIKSSKKSGVLVGSPAARQQIVTSHPTDRKTFVVNASWPQRESLAHVDTFVYGSCYNHGDVESPVVVTLRPLARAKFKLLSIFGC